MNNRYAFNIEWSEEDNEYIATSPAFPGMTAFGQSEEEALREGKIALGGLIETAKAKNIPLPEPTPRVSYSGKLQLRLPKSLHRQAARMADSEAVSLNTYIADAVRARVTGDEVAKPVVEEMQRQFAATRTDVTSVMTVQPIERYLEVTKEVFSERTVVRANRQKRKAN